MWVAGCVAGRGARVFCAPTCVHGRDVLCPAEAPETERNQVHVATCCLSARSVPDI